VDIQAAISLFSKFLEVILNRTLMVILAVLGASLFVIYHWLLPSPLSISTVEKGSFLIAVICAAVLVGHGLIDGEKWIERWRGKRIIERIVLHPSPDVARFLHEFVIRRAVTVNQWGWFPSAVFLVDNGVLQKTAAGLENGMLVYSLTTEAESFIRQNRERVDLVFAQTAANS
jgi:hypothetical protein